MQVLPWIHRTPNVHPLERWVSAAIGGRILYSGLKRGRILRALAGAAIAHRGLTGECQVYRTLGIRTAPSSATLPYESGVRARAAVTIAAPRHEIYQFWRQIENLPRFMRHLISVSQRDGKHSHWVAEGPGGNSQYAWDAEIINEIENELIAWKSLPGSEVASAGSVRFQDAPGDRGTEIRVELQYNPPAGIVGAWVARLFGREPEQEIQADLARLKQFFESGEVATTTGQPKGGPVAGGPGTSTIDEVLP